MRLRYLLVAAMLALGAPVLAADCAEWNTWEFFETATLEEVVGCLESGADVNARGGDDWTPLHFAAWLSNDPAISEVLLAAGADVNAQDADGGLPLHFAARQADYTDIIEVLLEAGADVSAQDKDGWTPLHFAAQYNDNPAVIRSLLEAG
ncbi:MAG: ankyrin repeat domain-containing protein, partial [Truepera sp.]|nr:ankyrin repeat domain-containing protein [Truepera sp.]